MVKGTIEEAETTTPALQWHNKNPYYHPKIHYVTQGLKSSQSARQYLFQFNAFLKFLGYNVAIRPCDLIGDTGTSTLKQDYDRYLLKLLETEPVQIEERIAEFLEHLKEKKHLKAASINLAKAALVHFFKRNRIRLNKDWISGYVPAEEGYKQDRPYTGEEIQHILDACSEDRIRVAIYLMASTSMRVGAIAHRVKEDMASVLEFGDLIWNSEYKIYKIMVYNRSKGGRYPTYCTPECARMIRKYLDYRRECGETITETSPLIREQFDPTDKLAISYPRKIQETTLTKVLRVVVKKAGLKDTLAHSVKLTHGYRKFAITMMNQAGVKDTHRRYLTGHAQVGQDASYVLPSDEDLLAEYVKAIPLLTIDPKARLQNKVEELESAKDERIAMLEQEIERNRKRTDHAIIMMEAVKGALDAKSKAASMALKDALGWR
jgi:hypothetical protein